MKQLKFCATLLLFISGILALRGIKPALFLMLAFAGLREIISAKEYQDAGEKKLRHCFSVCRHISVRVPDGCIIGLNTKMLCLWQLLLTEHFLFSLYLLGGSSTRGMSRITFRQPGQR